MQLEIELELLRRGFIKNGDSYDLGSDIRVIIHNSLINGLCVYLYHKEIYIYINTSSSIYGPVDLQKEINKLIN